MYFRQCNQYNYLRAERARKAIQYIVVHYTANDGDTARNNVDYFHRAILKNPASSHYFVDENEVACSVPWYAVAYHCGGKKYAGKNPEFYGKCTNSNSISVEMCSRVDGNGGFYIEEKTLERAANFVALLMETYEIPIDRVIRHYDVTGKYCPAPLVDSKAWERFKAMVLSCQNKEVEAVAYYETIDQIPKGELRDTISSLVDRGIIKGNGKGLHLSEDMVRTLVFVNRMLNA